LKEVTAMVAGHEFQLPAALDGTEPSLRLLREMPTSIRDALSWAAHVLDDSLPLRAAEDVDEYAHRHLGRTATGVTAVHERLGLFTAPLLSRALGADMRRHPPYELAGPYSDESPRWHRLRLDGATEQVPHALVAAFAPDTVMAAPCVVSIDVRHAPHLTVYARVEDADAAEEYVKTLLERARGSDNYLRGRSLQMHASRQGLYAELIDPPSACRDDVIVPDTVWSEIDTNMSALFSRRDLLRELGLGTNRGLLFVGPPGTGKSAICRILAAELAGEVTVVVCSADVVSGRLSYVYDELAYLAPALVFMEDVDLAVGRRGQGDDSGLQDFLAALDGAMSRHHDVLTIATTNDIKALDAAATRAARFDRIIQVPLPDAAARTAILRRYLGRLAEHVDVATVGRAAEGASGADLRELVRRGVLSHGEEVETAALLALVNGGEWAPDGTGQYL
jgi:hypothetical protein